MNGIVFIIKEKMFIEIIQLLYINYYYMYN